MGSSGQDFNAEFWISDLTFLTDKVLNADNVGNTLAVLSTEIDASWTVKSVISASICLWIKCIDLCHKILSNNYFVSKSWGVQVRR